MVWDLMPAPNRSLPCGIYHHFAIHNITEKTFPLMSAKGQKASPGPGIIVPFKTNRSAMVNVWIVFHFSLHRLDAGHYARKPVSRPQTRFIGGKGRKIFRPYKNKPIHLFSRQPPNSIWKTSFLPRYRLLFMVKLMIELPLSVMNFIKILPRRKALPPPYGSILMKRHSYHPPALSDPGKDRRNPRKGICTDFCLFLSSI